MIVNGIREAFALLLRGDEAVLSAAATSLQVTLFAVLLASLVGIALGILLARQAFPGRSLLIVLFRAGMSVPTVLIGLVCWGLLSRQGLFGELELLYTTRAIVIGEFLLAVPIITTWTHGAIVKLDLRLVETAMTLGAGAVRRTVTYLSEARLGVMLAVLTAFSRCFTELGIAMIVGGNLAGSTRTLTTATALETSQGEFSRGVAMSLILLFVATIVTVGVAVLSRDREETVS